MTIDLFNKLVAVVSHPRLDITYDDELDLQNNFSVGLVNVESFGLRLGMLAGYVRIALSFWASRLEPSNSFHGRLIETIKGIDCAFIPASMLYIYLIFKDKIRQENAEETFKNVQGLAGKILFTSGALMLLSTAGVILSKTRFDIPRITRHAYSMAVPALSTFLMSAYVSTYISKHSKMILSQNSQGESIQTHLEEI